MAIDQNELKRVTEAFKDYIGLHKFDLEIIRSSNSLQYIVHFTQVIDEVDFLFYDNPITGFREKVLEPVFKDIENSRYVKNLTSDLEDKVNLLSKEIEELKPYKTYYDLHYKMENGK